MYEADDGLFFQPGNKVTSLIRDRIGCGLVMLSWVMKMIWYHGEKKTSSYFEGWYLKCQTRDGRCLALIPAIHIKVLLDRTTDRAGFEFSNDP